MDDASNQEIIGLWNRLWRRTTVDQDTGCWVFTGPLNRTGYGYIRWGRQWPSVHRLAKIIFGERFDEELTLDHLCRNRACWRIDHLDPCTMRVNLLRGESFSAVNARKTHCIHGHELTPNNLVPNRAGRKCLVCHRESNRRASRRYQAVRRAAQLASPSMKSSPTTEV